MILPSSESNFFDYAQTSPINNRYPSPSSFVVSGVLLTSGSYTYSGIYATFKKEDLNYNSGLYPQNKESGIFHYEGLSGNFSNYAKFSEIKNNFRSFNAYIHYYPKNVENLNNINEDNMDENRDLKIPYLSSYRINTFIYNPYGALF